MNIGTSIFSLESGCHRDGLCFGRNTDCVIRISMMWAHILKEYFVGVIIAETYTKYMTV